MVLFQYLVTLLRTFPWSIIQFQLMTSFFKEGVAGTSKTDSFPISKSFWFWKVDAVELETGHLNGYGFNSSSFELNGLLNPLIKTLKKFQAYLKEPSWLAMVWIEKEEINCFCVIGIANLDPKSDSGYVIHTISTLLSRDLPT